MDQQQQMPQIDLANTQAITNENGGSIFQQGVILRKVSKFVAGTANDALLPIPIFYDPTTNKILTDSVPQELRDELNEELV